MGSSLTYLMHIRLGLAALAISAGLIAAAACGGKEEATATVAPKAPAATPTAAPAATATAQPTATQPAATKPAAPAGFRGTVTMAVPAGAIGTVSGITSRSAGSQPPGTGEYLFVMGDDGSPMNPWLAAGWSVDNYGTKATIKIRQGVKINSPVELRGQYPDGFGEYEASDFVWWLNEMNPFVNPNSKHGSGPNYANVFGKATAIDKYTFEVELRSPIYAFVPLTEFGIGGSSNLPEVGKVFDKLGEQTMLKYYVGTGPYVMGKWVTNERGEVEAVPHWADGSVYSAGRVQKFIYVAAPELTSRIAMLKGGQADIAEVDFKLVEDLEKQGLKFLRTMPGETGYVGSSVLFHGNLWEAKHGLTGEELKVWEEPPLQEDWPWIGCGFPDKCKYQDVNNPPGMSDMEQARIVRWGLSYAIDRDAINRSLHNNRGTPIYTEYMGVAYPGWDEKRVTTKAQLDKAHEAFCKDCPTYNIASPLQDEKWPWKIPFDPKKAEQLLDLAGYPKKADGTRFAITLNIYPCEVGEVCLAWADAVSALWTNIGIKTSLLREDYGTVIHPRIRLRDQIFPTIKNGEVHSNDWPLDFWMPPTDTSLSRPGWGPFEDTYLVRNHLKIRGSKDKAERVQLHFDAVDWMNYWHLYAGIGQIPKGVMVNPKRIESWVGRRAHYQNLPPPNANPAVIKLVAGQ